MPLQSLRKCTYPGCHVLVKSGRCPEHSSKRIVRDPEIKRLYNSKRWRSLRVAHLADFPWCQDCLKEGAHTLATEIDHIQPHRGDPVLFFDDHNLQSLCKMHHSRKTADEVLNR